MMLDLIVVFLPSSQLGSSKLSADTLIRRSEYNLLTDCRVNETNLGAFVTITVMNFFVRIEFDYRRGLQTFDSYRTDNLVNTTNLTICLEIRNDVLNSEDARRRQNLNEEAVTVSH